MITDIQHLDLNKRRLSVVTKKKPKPKRVEHSELSPQNRSENLEHLRQAEMYWSALRDFRDRRKKNRKYYRGDQWHETMTNPDYSERAASDSLDSQQTITEEQYIMNQGKIPFKQNMIRQLGRNILGQYRSNPNESIVMARSRDKATQADMMSNALSCARYINHAKELEARNCEEFFLSGSAFTKIGYKYIKTRDQEDVKLYNPHPARMYYNRVMDIRLDDMAVIGEIIDDTLESIISTFAKTTDDEARIRGYYTGTQNELFSMNDNLQPDTIDNLDFYLATDPNMCRFYEHWFLKSEWRIYAHDYVDGSYTITDKNAKELDEINQMRIARGLLQGIPPEEVPLIEYEKKKEQLWYCKFLTPKGDVLWEGESPYLHQEHPYVPTLYPLLDGEVWSIVEDVIDQQRAVNRLFALYDFIMGSGAKGVLMIDEDMVTNSRLTPEQFAEQWTKFNGVIYYKSKPGMEKPYQISANSTNVGIMEMLQVQMQMFKDISGVSDAIQGKDPKSGTPSSLYAQVAQNSMINIKDFFDSYAWHRQRVDQKIIKVIKQFYKDKRYLATSGKVYNEESMVYDPQAVRDVDYDNVVTPSTDTPVYRAIIDDTLMKLLEVGLIDLEMFLENSAMPMADKILESVKMRKQQLQQGQIPAGGEMLPPEIQQQLAAGQDPRARAMMQKAMNTAA